MRYMLFTIWPANHESRGVALCFRALGNESDNNGRRIQMTKVVLRAINYIMAKVFVWYAIAKHNGDVMASVKSLNSFVAIGFGQAERQVIIRRSRGREQSL